MLDILQYRGKLRMWTCGTDGIDVRLPQLVSMYISREMVMLCASIICCRVGLVTTAVIVIVEHESVELFRSCYEREREAVELPTSLSCR